MQSTSCWYRIRMLWPMNKYSGLSFSRILRQLKPHWPNTQHNRSLEEGVFFFCKINAFALCYSLHCRMTDQLKWCTVYMNSHFLCYEALNRPPLNWSGHAHMLTAKSGLQLAFFKKASLLSININQFLQILLNGFKIEFPFSLA